MATIASLHEAHFAQLREVLDTVAREGQYLAFLQAPPPDEAFAFYRSLIESDCPAVVALGEYFDSFFMGLLRQGA